MTEKMQPCCARRQAKVAESEAYLQRLARRAAYHASRGRDITKLKAMIDDAKIAILNDKKFLTEHEAEHADD